MFVDILGRVYAGFKWIYAVVSSESESDDCEEKLFEGVGEAGGRLRGFKEDSGDTGAPFSGSGGVFGF
jgi:hypothetical protein